jgi:hypothetical protein
VRVPAVKDHPVLRSWRSPSFTHRASLLRSAVLPVWGRRTRPEWAS